MNVGEEDKSIVRIYLQMQEHEQLVDETIKTKIKFYLWHPNQMPFPRT